MPEEPDQGIQGRQDPTGQELKSLESNSGDRLELDKIAHASNSAHELVTHREATEAFSR